VIGKISQYFSTDWAQEMSNSCKETKRKNNANALIRIKRKNKKNKTVGGFANMQSPGVTIREGHGLAIVTQVDPEKPMQPYLVKIPLSCRQIERLKLEFQMWQEYCPESIDFEVTTGFSHTSGGIWRFGVVMDAADAADDSYEKIVDMITSSAIKGTQRFGFNRKFSVPMSVFKNLSNDGWRKTSAFKNERNSEVGFLYIVADSLPSAAGSISVDVKYRMKFRQPTIEPSKSNGFFDVSLEAKSGKNYLLPSSLWLMESFTLNDLRTLFPDLPGRASVLKLSRVGNATYKVGAGDISVTNFEYVFWDPDATVAFITPIMRDKDGVLSIRTDNFDHADAADTFKLSVQGDTGFENVGDTVEDVNYATFKRIGAVMKSVVDAFGRRSRRVIIPGITDEFGNSLQKVQPVENLKTLEGRSSGPLPPTEATMKIDTEQYNTLVSIGDDNNEEIEDLSKKVASEHTSTRAAVAASSTTSTTELNALIVAEGERNRGHCTIKNAEVQVALAADIGVVSGICGSTLTRVQNVDSNVTLLQGQVQTVSQKQIEDSDRLLAVHSVVNGTAVQVTESKEANESSFRMVDKQHRDILQAIENIPKFNNYDLIRYTVDRMRILFGKSDLLDFRNEFNILLAAFQLEQVTPVDYDVVITHDKLKSYLSTGHLYPVHSSSDVPMPDESKPDYVWPNYHVAPAEDLVGLYFRTQYANLDGFPDTKVYTYFRINSTSDGKMFCSEHETGADALPRPSKN